MIFHRIFLFSVYVGSSIISNLLCYSSKSEEFTSEEQFSNRYLRNADDFNQSSPEKDFVSIKENPIISDPLFEDAYENVSMLLSSNSKRNIIENGLTQDMKMEILQLHNLYRGNVTPPAGNMAFMEWDSELERLAQAWSDKCVFEHGMPDNEYPDTIGQNLYIGTDPTGYNGLWLWFDEYHHFDVRKQSCVRGKQCGHYIQMAWAFSKRLGCGMTKCGMRYLFTCHYSPQALRGVHIYIVGKPCSQCPQKNGALCIKNLCLSWKQCKRNPFYCGYAECNLKCHNCGQLDVEKCRCDCLDGWDSPDCSKLCTNQHVRCGKNPGWPSSTACSLNNYAVAEIYCREMCKVCSTVVENENVYNNTCCGGKLCDEGYVLDPEQDCECVLLCPGPKCDSKGKLEEEEEEKAEASLSRGNNLELVHITSCLIYVCILLRFQAHLFWM